MMEEVKEDFPGYQEAGFLDALEKAIGNREVILEEEEGKLAGMISFSYEEKVLTFLAVRPEFRKCGIGRKLVERVKGCFHNGEELSVVTFRAGDERGGFCLAVNLLELDDLERVMEQIKEDEMGLSVKEKASHMAGLRMVQAQGGEAFMEKQKEKFTCSKCGGIISIHDAECSECQEKMQISERNERV